MSHPLISFPNPTFSFYSSKVKSVIGHPANHPNIPKPPLPTAAFFVLQFAYVKDPPQTESDLWRVFVWLTFTI